MRQVIRSGLILGVIAQTCCVWGQQLETLPADVVDVKAGEEIKFLRLVSKEKDPVALQAAIVRYESEDGSVVVDLVSAIHVADPGYYADLNKRFRDYEAVLYELVAPEGTRVPKGGGDHDSPVSWLQGAMTKVLGLSFQLEEVDYTKKNLVHADMSPEEFAKSMRDRGESMLTIFLNLMREGLQQQSQDVTRTNEMKLWAALFSADREHKLKVFMAEQFADLDKSMSAFEGKNGSTLVTGRNKKALKVLKRELKSGRKHVAIFYGAGHMRDMGERLEEEFQLQPTTITWLDAWDLRVTPEKTE